MSSKISKGGKEARLKEGGGGGGGKGGQKGCLTDASCHLQTPRRYGTFPWASRKGRAGTRPYQKPDQKIQVLCQEEMISLQSAQAEALRPDSCIQDQGARKTGRIGRAKEREGERSIKSLVPYQSGHSGQLSASGGDQGEKGPSCGRWVWSIGRQAGR